KTLRRADHETVLRLVEHRKPVPLVAVARALRGHHTTPERRGSGDRMKRQSVQPADAGCPPHEPMALLPARIAIVLMQEVVCYFALSAYIGELPSTVRRSGDPF